jgi:hypothetical protein
MNWLVSSIQSDNRLLEPMERITEVLFALIMALTFTCSFSVASAGREEVRAMLVGVLGCNIAWGIIDAFFHLMNSFSDFGQRILKLKAVRGANTPLVAHRVIADALPPVVASILSPSDLEAMRLKLKGLPAPPTRPRLRPKDLWGALATFLVVVLSTLPVVAPFTVISDTRRALRTSNSIAILMLFVAGYAFGRLSGHRPLTMGVAMVVLGGAMVAITIALGG